MSVRQLGGRGRRAAGDPAAKSKANQPRATSPRIAELAHDLSEHFDTRVKVDFGKKKGKIAIEFATIGDLERIVAMMKQGK